MFYVLYDKGAQDRLVPCPHSFKLAYNKANRVISETFFLLCYIRW